MPDISSDNDTSRAIRDRVRVPTTSINFFGPFSHMVAMLPSYPFRSSSLSSCSHLSHRLSLSLFNVQPDLLFSLRTSATVSPGLNEHAVEFFLLFSRKRDRIYPVAMGRGPESAAAAVVNVNTEDILKLITTCGLLLLVPALNPLRSYSESSPSCLSLSPARSTMFPATLKSQALALVGALSISLLSAGSVHAQSWYTVEKDATFVSPSHCTFSIPLTHAWN